MHLCLFQRNNGGGTLRVKLVKPEEMQFLFLFSAPGKAVPDTHNDKLEMGRRRKETFHFSALSKLWWKF
jgi:hypothetical protein